jgi:tRNA (guanine10-N2)-dimethyltransferase
MNLVFYLSGEHETLPKAEVLGLLETRRMKCEVVEDLDQVLVCSVKRYNVSSMRVLAMTHSVLEHIGSCEAEMDKIISLGENVGEISETFSVRVQRIKDSSKDIKTLALEKSIGDAINGESVDLKSPEVPIEGFLTSGRFVMGKRVLEIKRSEFDKRSPHLRPYFHPSSLSPVLSRSLCNICGVEGGMKVLDPFCGTGGLLIEAGLLDGEIFGIDLDERMVRWTRENLSHYGISGTVEPGDATKITYSDFFDIVLTDPPYGRSSTTMGKNVETLYKRAVESIFYALKKGGIACIIAPDTIDLMGIAEKTGFTVDKIHLMRVHRSLTRRIVIMEK